MKKMQNSYRSASIWKYLVFPGLLIIVVAVIINFFIYRLESNLFATVYNNEVVGTTSLIGRRLQSALMAAESTKAFFISSQEVTPSEFEDYAAVISKSMISSALTLPITIEWVDADNNIRYVYPQNEDNAKIVGLDLNQYPNRLAPITKAKTIKSPVITEAVLLGQGYPGLILYSPIFKNDNYMGEAVIVIRLSDLLAPIPGTNLLYEQNEYLQTGDFIIPMEGKEIFTTDGQRVINPQGERVNDPASQPFLSEKDKVSRDVVFADKTWQIKFTPTYMIEINRRVLAYLVVSFLIGSTTITFLWILHKQQQQLIAQTAKTQALIDSIGDGLVACDKNGLITYINQKAEELSGYSSQEAIGRSYYDIWKIIDDKGTAIPTEQRLFYRALSNKEIVVVSTTNHLSVVKKDGSHFPLASTISPILVNNNVEGAIVVFRDISLESEVDRMKTEFLSLVSHQLLTPSSSIKWNCELLLGGDYGKLTNKPLEGIRDIKAANDSMIALVNSLLNISRIESGRLIVDPKPTYLSDLVSRVLKEVDNKINDKQQVLTLKVEKNLPQINIDPRLIEEVYKNLLTNAIKYTPTKGNISVTISKNDTELISQVIDNGYGIPTKDKSRIFSKFYRGENVSNIEKEGNGLGLYLIKQIIDVSGGKIGFTSEINKGTTFWFSLPLSGSEPKKGEVTVT